MPLVKRKTAPKTRLTQKDLFDEYAQLTEEIKPKLKRQKTLKAQIDSIILKRRLKDDSTCTLIGNSYSIAVSAKTEKSVIKNMLSVFKLLKTKDFWENVTMTIGALKKHTTDAEFDRLTEKVPAYRTLKVSAKDILKSL